MTRAHSKKDPFGRARPLYATCDSGLEQILAAELGVYAQEVKPGHRGVQFVGDRLTLWRANVESRVANRILVPVAEFPARDRQGLYESVKRIKWHAWFHPGRTIAVDASVHESAFQHSGFAAQVVKDGICDRFRAELDRRPSVDRKRPDVRINLRVDGDACTVSIDSSGERLHRRGYRTEAGEAPLKETLAAGILNLANWRDDMTLVDPMCGSGTFLIEAALIASRTAPGLVRRVDGGYGFMAWFGHRTDQFQRYLEKLRARVRPLPADLLHGSDLDPEVIEIARANAVRAGFGDAIDFQVADITARLAPQGRTPGCLVVNPPYGERLTGDLVKLYADLGHMLKRQFSGYTAHVLVGQSAPIKSIGLKTARKTRLHNGPIPCSLARYRLFAGSGTRHQ